MSSDAFVSCAAAADASLAPASGSNSQKHSDDANDTGSHGESWKQAARDWSSTAAMQVSWAADLTHDLTRQLWLDTATVHRDMVAVQAGPRQQLCLVVNAWMLDRAKLESRRKQAQDEVQRVLAVLQRAQQQWAGHCAAMEAQLDLVRAEKQRLALEVAVLRARPSQPDPALSPSPTAPPAPAPPTGILGSTAPPAPAPPTGILGSAAPPAPPSAGRGPSAGLPPLPLHRPPRGSSNTTAMLSPSPIVDVQALDASLQGIRIRAHVAQRPTFAHAEPTSRPRIHQPMAAARKNSHQIRHAGPAARRARRWSPTSAPLYHHHHLPDDAAALRLRPHGGPRPPLSCNRTHQLLAANESRRLTLHAGHTPNHTLSSIPTMTDTAQDSTHCRSLRQTPPPVASPPPSVFFNLDSHHGRVEGHDDQESSHDGDDEDDNYGQDHCVGKDDDDDDDNKNSNSNSNSNSNNTNNSDDDHDVSMLIPDHVPLHRHLHRHGSHNQPLSLLPPPTHDAPLRGPLLVKNLPAHDDLFFAQLNQKLESVRRGQDAIPSVLRDSSSTSDLSSAAPQDPSAQQPGSAPATAIPFSLFGASGLGLSSRGAWSAPHMGDHCPDPYSPSDSEDGEKVPIKFRKTNNFGAPFGTT